MSDMKLLYSTLQIKTRYIFIEMRLDSLFFSLDQKLWLSFKLLDQRLIWLGVWPKEILNKEKTEHSSHVWLDCLNIIYPILRKK